MYTPMIVQDDFDAAKALGAAQVERLLMREKRAIAAGVGAQLRAEGVRFWTLRFWSGTRMVDLVREAFELFNSRVVVDPYVMAPGLTLYGEVPQAAGSNDAPAVPAFHSGQQVYYDPVTREEYRADQVPMVALFDKHKSDRLRVM